MNSIKVLPQLLVDKIAAGEVIERPASVVKELLENAIDAGANEIKIEIEDGGKKLIRVSDNGAGINKDDIKLLFISHATSKIVEENDLYAIKTLGFRGEALASIASVSQIRVVSKTKDDEPARLNDRSGGSAWEIIAHGEVRENPKPTAGSTGTIAEVSNIFFNTPVRLKFLKSTPVEFGHISDIVTRYALSFPEVRFDLIHNNNPVLNLPATVNLTERFRYLLGEDLTSALIKIDIQEDNWQVKGYISTPSFTKSTMRMQWIYLNHRYIRDRIISRAIMQAYSDFVPAQRFPVAILFITLPSSEFDANVHPTKIEVRFRNTWEIHNWVTNLIRKTLTSSPAISPQSIGMDKDDSPQIAPIAGNQALQAMVDFFSGNEQNKSPNVQIPYHPTRPIEEEIIKPPNQYFQLSHQRSYIQVHNSYIIKEVPDGIIIIDQHALHERLIYERLKSADKGNAIPAQQLLVPETLQLELRQISILKEALPHLKELGFQIEEFGNNTILIRAVPNFLTASNVGEMISDILQTMVEEGSPAKQGQFAIKDNLLKLLACKAAIKAGTYLSEEEIRALLHQYDNRSKELQGDLTCPHGRPAVYKINHTQLARYFLR